MFSIVLLSLMVKFHVIQLEDTKFLVQLNTFVEPNYAVLLFLVFFPTHKPPPKSQANANKHSRKQSLRSKLSR